MLPGPAGQLPFVSNSLSPCRNFSTFSWPPTRKRLWPGFKDPGSGQVHFFRLPGSSSRFLGSCLGNKSSVSETKQLTRNNPSEFIAIIFITDLVLSLTKYFKFFKLRLRRADWNNCCYSTCQNSEFTSATILFSNPDPQHTCADETFFQWNIFQHWGNISHWMAFSLCSQRPRVQFLAFTRLFLLRLLWFIMMAMTRISIHINAWVAIE